MTTIKLVSLTTFFWWWMSSFYGLPVTDMDGSPMDLHEYAGKKILIVNTAGDCREAVQYAALETLYQKYKDSLMIIACPSNSFGSEPTPDADVDSFVMNTYHISFRLAAKSEVAGESVSPLYAWLTSAALNGVTSSQVKGDFQKYLVDENGNLTGIFDASVDPMDPELQNAIEAH